MATLSLSVPEKLKNQMNRFDRINWSEVATKAFEEKLKQIKFLAELSRKSKLTEKDAADISKKINRRISRKLRGR